MTITSTTSTSDGVTATFSIPFPFFSRAHVEVLVDGAAYGGAVAWLSDSSISLSPVPASGAKVTRRRVTPDTPARSTFTNSNIASTGLNANQTQDLYLAQEKETALGRAMMAPHGEAGLTMASAAARAGMVQEYDETGASKTVRGFPDIVAQIATLLGLDQLLSGLAPAANMLAYFSGSSTMALTSLTSLARTLLANATAAEMRTTLAVPGTAALVAADGAGGDLIASKASSGPSYLRTYRDTLGDEISLWDIAGIGENKAAIIAGSYTPSLTTAINTALANYKRVIVRSGLYPIGAPVLFGLSEQILEFEESAWFQATTSAMNGIACPHGILDAKLINPGLIGRATTEVMHTAVLWNTTADGTAPFGSTTTDDMAGLVSFGRFKGLTPGTNGWNTFIHSNMAGGFRALNCVGKGLYGTASNNGYGHVFSGANVSNEGCDFDSLIAGQGRHAVYLGDQCAGALVAGLRARRFRKSAIAANTGVSGANTQIKIRDFVLTDVALDADSSASIGAVELSYQGAASSGGSNVSITNGQVKGVGAMGCYMRGYNKVMVTDLLIEDWGNNAGGSYSAFRVVGCDDVTLTNFQSYSSAENNGASVIQHVFIQESARAHIKGGRAVNTGSGAQGSAVTLNATGTGTPDGIVDRFQAIKGSGSWSLGAFVNPTQNGSAFVAYKDGSVVVDTQTGADITLDASAGQSVFVMNSAASSVLQILPAAAGQVVTLRMTGLTQIKQSNVYSPSVFNADANDTCTLMCGNANGASSLWYELSRSAN